MEDFEKVDEVIDWFKEQVREKQVLGAEVWVRGAQTLNILSTGESDKLFDLQQVVAQKKMRYIDNLGLSVSKAKAKVEATDEYKEMMRQKAKMEHITEMIRLSKIQAKLANDSWHNN